MNINSASYRCAMSSGFVVAHSSISWGSALFLAGLAARSCAYGSISTGLLRWIFAPWRCARCFIAVRASRRRFRSCSTGRSIRCGCAGIVRHGATPCGSTPPRARSCSPCRRAARVREARDFAQKHGAWIAARLKRLPQAAPFAHGSEVPLRGDPHRIVHRRGMRGTVWTATDDDGNRLLCVAGEAPHINRRIGDYLRRAAARDLNAAARRYADELGVTIKRISIRDQSSRWGSCSNAGVLSFSWRLILAPPHVLDYLAAHEVAHLVELNHSATVLAAGRAHLPRFRARQGLARSPRHRPAPLRRARRRQRQRGRRRGRDWIRPIQIASSFDEIE